MNDISARLTLLQYGDSFYPSGGVSFSWGLEGLVECGVVPNAAKFERFLLGQLRNRWAPYDRCVVAAAHLAQDHLSHIASIDHTVEITTSAGEVRAASRRMGAAMLLVFAQLGHENANAYRALIAKGNACGHLCAMQGMLWAAVGLQMSDAIALSAHTFCTSLVSAGVRLGCITHLEAQKLLAAGREEASRLACSPLLSPNEIATHAPEAEIAVMQHALRDLRLFAN